MRRSRRGGCVWGLTVMALALTIGCGSDRHGSPGPGGATFTGSVSNANTASVARLRSTWLAWLGEHVLGFARPAYAQARDISLGGITVIVRGGGRELSDLTDSSGGFVVSDAPTGEVTVLFRRGSCEGSLPIGGVVSTSTLTLVGVSFLCSPGSDVAAVSLANLGERFNGVTRENPSDQSQVRLCTRVGNDDVLRTISVEGADIVDTGGAATTFADLEEHDLLQIDGFRSEPGSSFGFDTRRVQVKEHNVTDECAGV